MASDPAQSVELGILLGSWSVVLDGDGIVSGHLPAAD
jgi:hypothetical protein